MSPFGQWSAGVSVRRRYRLRRGLHLREVRPGGRVREALPNDRRQRLRRWSRVPRSRRHGVGMGRLRVKPLRRVLWATSSLGWAVGLAALASCGSRTTFTVEEGPPPPPECTKDKDCDGFGDKCFPVACVANKCKDKTPVDCDDKNVCTTDRCEPETGTCSHASAVLDLDGDGHAAPLPGKRPGDPGACGDDCDDTNAAAHPGGMEICDGVD